VTHAVQGRGHKLARNIPALVANIEPAVKKAMELNPGVEGDAIIPMAIEANVWTGIEELFMESPVTRDFVKKGFAKVVGAIYDVGTGKVNWLPEDTTFEILAKVEASPDKAVMAPAEDDESHGHHAAEPTEPNAEAVQNHEEGTEIASDSETPAKEETKKAAVEDEEKSEHEDVKEESHEGSEETETDSHGHTEEAPEVSHT